MTLVVMAAGLGSRYGAGCKQIEGVGPSGEILLEYAAYDAVQAGFSKIVFIIKEDMTEFIDGLCAVSLSKLKTADGTPVEIACVCQDYSTLPEFYAVPEGRNKPFGTVHATLCAKELVREPFAVINADDFYGPEAFRVMYEALETLSPEHEACMVGYRLANTVSEYGAVNRGVCREENGVLADVTETYRIVVCPDGSIRNEEGKEGSVRLDPEALASMNFWGYTPWMFGCMETYFEEFLQGLAADDVKSECLLPVMTDALIKSGELRVKVLQTEEKWFGMTYAADRALVAAELKQLHEAGRYPATLRP